MTAFIFDVDGTLVESEELHRDAFNEAFGKANLSWHWDTYRYKELLKVSGGKERMRVFVDEEEITPETPLDELVEHLHRSKTEVYTQAVKDGALALKPGVAALIAEARRRGVRLAIATTTSRDNVDALLQAVFPGENGIFEVIACGDMVPAKKPAPDIYELALRELGLPASACLAFEDSSNGLRAAKAAGLRCIITPALYTRDEDFTDADLVLDDLTDPTPVFALLAKDASAGTD